MFRLLERISHGGATARSYFGIVTSDLRGRVDADSLLRDRLGEFCHWAAAVLDASLEASADVRPHAHAVLDRTGALSRPRIGQTSMSSIDLLVDKPLPGDRREVYSFRAHLNFLGLGDVGAAAGGNEAFRKWLVNEFVLAWEDATESTVADWVTRLARQATTVWPYGTPTSARRGSAPTAANPAPALPEDRYLTARAFLEIPDEPDDDLDSDIQIPEGFFDDDDDQK